ncbi:MAG: glutathione S-transferase family protein [Povalibacter sp.]
MKIVPMLSLVIGNKQLSSWSLRPWLLLRHLDLPFEEISLTLDVPDFGPAVREYSPAARVPVLVDGSLRVWDSLAIIEYLHERSGGRAWPTNVAERAHARSISAEMHAGFAALRENWPMQATSRGLNVPLPVQGINDVQRIQDIWQDCRERYAARGPWLFGTYSAADAMYAPVVLRFLTYGAPVSSSSQAYVEQALSDPHLQEWISTAQSEVSR